jgi:hypothetical protein
MCSNFADRHVTFEIGRKYNANLTSYLQSLSSKEEVRNEFIRKIISTGYENCYLEFPPLHKPDGTPEKFAEFTITESRQFLSADWLIFRDQLKSLAEISSKRKKYAVCYFPNLSGETLLVCPVPTLDKKLDKYSDHLMDFLNNGDKGQVHELIKMFALKSIELLSKDDMKKVYISTHGHGVPWLHIRLSPIPKYYAHKSYFT